MRVRIYGTRAFGVMRNRRRTPETIFHIYDFTCSRRSRDARSKRERHKHEHINKNKSNYKNKGIASSQTPAQAQACATLTLKGNNIAPSWPLTYLLASRLLSAATRHASPVSDPRRGSRSRSPPASESKGTRTRGSRSRSPPASESKGTRTEAV
jgi:hypothetical protein